MRKPHNTGRTANSTILKNLKFQKTPPKQTQPGSHRKCELWKTKAEFLRKKGISWDVKVIIKIVDWHSN